MYYEGDELVCLFCGGLVDAPIESDSGDSNPDGWRFSHSFFSFFFLFFFSLLLCFSCRVTCPTVLLLLMSCNLFVVCIGQVQTILFFKVEQSYVFVFYDVGLTYIYCAQLYRKMSWLFEKKKKKTQILTDLFHLRNATYICLIF